MGQHRAGMLLTHSELAQAIGVPSSQLTGWRKAGMPCVSDDAVVGGKVTYDLAAVFRWVREVGRHREAEEGGEVVPALEQGRLARERRLKVALDRRLKAGELVASKRVAQEVFPVVRAFRDGVLSVPDRLAPVLAALSDAAEVHARMTSELRGLLDNLEAGLTATASGLCAAVSGDGDGGEDGDDE